MPVDFLDRAIVENITRNRGGAIRRLDGQVRMRWTSVAITKFIPTRKAVCCVHGRNLDYSLV